MFIKNKRKLVKVIPLPVSSVKITPSFLVKKKMLVIKKNLTNSNKTIQ